MKKILFIGNFLSKTRGTIGPSEKVAKNIHSSGMKINIASSFENPIIRCIDIFQACLLHSYSYIHIDVYSGRSFFIAIMACTIAKLRNKTIFITLHGGRLPEFYKGNEKKIDYLFKNSDKILTPSLFIQDFFIRKGYNVVHIPNAIDLNLFKEQNSFRKKRSILWIRGFQKIYNPLIAIKIIDQLKENYHDVTMTMIGPDLGLMNQCKALVNEKKLNKHVKILGQLKNDELPKYLSSHEVYINTTSFESFGVALIEAASCGIPIVSSSVGEIPLLWKNENEILFIEKLNINSFTEKISLLFEDPLLRERLSRNAKKKVESYNWDNIKLEWLKLFDYNGMDDC